MTHALHCNPLRFYPGSDGSNTALSSEGKKDSFVLSNKVIQNDGHSCAALCHNGPDEPHSPTPGSPSSPPPPLLVLPACHRVSPHTHSISVPRGGADCHPASPLCPTHLGGPLLVDTALTVAAQMRFRPHVCPTRAWVTRGRRGGLEDTRFGSFLLVLSYPCCFRGGGSQVIIYTGRKLRTYI